MFNEKKNRNYRGNIEDHFRDKKWILVKKWYQLLLNDVWKWAIDAKSRYYILKELQRHKDNLNNWHWTFIPDISALLELYT